MAIALTSCDMINSLLGGEEEKEEIVVPDDGEDVEENPEEEKKPVISLAGITLPSLELVYDGKEHSTEIVGTLPDGVSVKYEGNGATDAGEHTVKAKFYYNDAYLEGKDISATIKILRARIDTYGVYFSSCTVVYNGEGHSLELSSVPEGVTVEYVGNGASAVGEHTVTAKLKVDEKNYEPIADMTATIRIVDGPAVFAGARINDLDVTYDGREYTLSINDVPGIEAHFTNAAATNAGTHTATVVLTSGEESLTMTPVLTVHPRRISVSAEDATYTYTGSKRSIKLVWGFGDEMDGIIVTEIGNNTAAIGEHKVTFRFSLSEAMRGNVEYIPDVTATLTIKPNPNNNATTGLEYMSSSNGFVVTGYTGAQSGVIIPENYTNSLGVSGRVVGIDAGAFEGNTKIEYVYIPPTVKNIGNKAFSGCTSLKSVTLSYGITAIGSLAFEDTAIADVIVPDSVVAIGQSAFRGAKVERITLPFIGGSRKTSNFYIGYIFGASAYGGNAQFLPETLKTVILSDSCPLIPAYSFYGADKIEEIVIGKGVTEIGISAFAGCESLIGLYIPKTVTDIPAAAYAYNSPVWGCKDDFIMASDAEYTLTGWALRYDILNDYKKATKIFSTTYEEFLKAVRENLFLKK